MPNRSPVLPACCLVLTLAILLDSAAQASPLGMFGFTSRGAAMGNALTAAADDVSAVHYNLAAMTRSKTASGFGFTIVNDDVYIRLKPRPDGIDPPGYDNRLNGRADTSSMGENQGVSIGFIHDLWSRRFRFGVAVYVPTNAIQSQVTHFNDEFEQFFSNQLTFELIGERTRKQTVKFGGAYELVEGLFSAGLGVNMFIDSRTRAYTYQPSVVAFDQLLINLDNEQVHTFSALAGLHLHLQNGVNVGFAYREAVDFPIKGGNIVQVGGLAEGESAIVQAIDLVVQFSPEEYALGVSYSGLEGWSFAADVLYHRWSDYVTTQNDQPSVEFDDVFIPRFGVEHQMSERVKVRGGYSFVTSPAPDSTGRYNFVDNDRHVVSFGLGYEGTVKDLPFSVDFHVQAHLLREREVNKDLNADNPVVDEDPLVDGLQTGNPGFPGWTSGGSFVATGLSVTFRRIFPGDDI